MRLGAAAVSCIILASLALSTRAQEVKKPPPTELTADLSFVDVAGNTSTSTVSTNQRYIRRIQTWEFKQDIGVVYGKTGGIESANAVRVGLRADHDLASHFALCALTAFDRNPYAGIRSRFAEGLGGVWKVLATDKDQFIGWDTTGLLTSSDVRGAQGMTGRARFFISASISAISRGAELIRSSPRSVIT